MLSEERKNYLAAEFGFSRYQEQTSEKEWGIMDKLDEICKRVERLDTTPRDEG